MHECVSARACVRMGSRRVGECIRALARVAFLIQHATCMHHIVMSFVASLAPPYFSHKRHDFREKVVDQEMFVLVFSTTFVKNISHSKKNSAKHCRKCQNVYIKYPLFLPDFNET